VIDSDVPIRTGGSLWFDAKAICSDQLLLRGGSE
jgi:hypothetical protein